MKISGVPPLILVGVGTILGWLQGSGDGRLRQGDARAVQATVAVVAVKSTTVRQSYPCRITTQRPIFVETPVEGQLAEVLVKEGQTVQRGDLLFRVRPTRDKDQPETRNRDEVVAITAPCAGPLVGPRLPLPGSYVRRGDSLATLTDASGICVEFAMPERHYLAFMAEQGENWRSPDLELILADQSKFPHVGKLVNILARFANETGDVTFVAEFPNPDGRLHPWQAGTLVIVRVFKDALLIPRRAMFADQARRYVAIVTLDHVAHRREIQILAEVEDGFIVREGIKAGDRLVLDKAKHIRDGARVE